MNMVGHHQDSAVHVGDTVVLRDEDDSIVPAGTYPVTQVNEDGSFHVGGRTAVWPRRIETVH